MVWFALPQNEWKQLVVVNSIALLYAPISVCSDIGKLRHCYALAWVVLRYGKCSGMGNNAPVWVMPSYGYATVWVMLWHG